MSTWVRQLHRWLAVAFTAGFIVNAVIIKGLGQTQPPFWIYLLALVPLFISWFGVGERFPSG